MRLLTGLLLAALAAPAAAHFPQTWSDPVCPEDGVHWHTNGHGYCHSTPKVCAAPEACVPSVCLYGDDIPDKEFWMYQRCEPGKGRPAG